MNASRNFVLVPALMLLIVISGCGGSSSRTHTDDEVVSVAPPTATVNAGGQVTLQATVTGCDSACPAPALTWTITELQTNGASGAQCNWQGATPPAGPCPSGTIEGADTPPFLSVTFHAPNTPGTIHVVASDIHVFTNPPVTKTGTAVITVP